MITSRSNISKFISDKHKDKCLFSPSITKSDLPKSVSCVMEIVINGLTSDDISAAIYKSIKAISQSKIKKDIIAISAGNYGGKLGQHHFHLRKIMK